MKGCLILLLLVLCVAPAVCVSGGNHSALFRRLCCGDATCAHRLQLLARRLGHGGEGRIVDTFVDLGVLPSVSAADVEACAYISEGVGSRSLICSWVTRLYS
jgi:hypothetical protein